jgi:hypothetical protein
MAEDHALPPRPDRPGPTGFSSTETNTLAVFSFVVSLFWIFGFASILAIVLGVVAHSQIDRSGGRQPGAGLATLGITLGAIGLIAAIVLFIMLMNQVEHEAL